MNKEYKNKALIDIMETCRMTLISCRQILLDEIDGKKRSEAERIYRFKSAAEFIDIQLKCVAVVMQSCKSDSTMDSDHA